jgi:3-deoxy-D-manno-octulosonic acid kinase
LAGVFHADLNAYNIQIDKDDKVWLVDFDRGRLRQPGRWQQQNLARLHRSLQKIKGLDPRLYFSEANWEQLLEGYFSSSRFA